jgi:hypothetical protein
LQKTDRGCRQGYQWNLGPAGWGITHLLTLSSPSCVGTTFALPPTEGLRMKFAKVDPGVDPRKQITLIIIWTVFNLLACIGFIALFLSGLLSRRLRRNRVLLSLYAVFVIATAAGPLLTWTGHVMNREVPIGLCIVSGAFGSSWSLAQVSSTFALVLKVSDHLFYISFAD